MRLKMAQKGHPLRRANRSHMPDIKTLTEKIKAFRDERDWLQYHGHKDLLISLMIEYAELLEHFQWKTSEEFDAHLATHREDVADECADVAIYLLELADNLGIDLADAIEKKLAKNALKYPTEKAKGSAKKYSDFS